ncbi:MAG: TAT-variant-translocated molybdopterin oxidoreductase [Verrucomicrobia bacterium]|nr:TAT-variant-translocated molybdopterin oxidoreductase [Verrucomicrobiota bacterium]
MKTIPPICPEPETGRKYWRSLEQLNDQPEFREWLEREFPEGASAAPEGESRRDWMKLMSASFLLAGMGGLATGCRRPEEELLPFGKQPEGYLHGGWKYFATAMPSRGSATPVLAKWTDGRPTKLEPNSLAPGSAGTDAQVQAAILNLYDPDRAIRHTFQGNDVDAAKVADMLSGLSQKFGGNAGEGLWILSERSSSPTRARLQTALSEKYGRSRWVNYEPVDFHVHRTAASVIFGAEVQPRYRLDQAKRILSLDANLFGAEADAGGMTRGFAAGRKPGEGMNRLYVVESLMTTTGGQADHRLRVKPSEVVRVAAQVAAQLVTGGTLGAALQKLAEGSPAPAGWAAECAKDLAAHRGEAVVVAGYTQPLAVHLIAAALNEALGAHGKTVELRQAETPADTSSMADLVAALYAGQVDTLVILGGNPAYNAPADLKFSEAAKKAKSVVRLGYYEDETFSLATWNLASAHFLEAWGDARGATGAVLPVQPLIQPLFGGLSDLEVLARLLGHPITTPYDLVRETFKGLTSGEENAWNQFLHDGFLADSAGQPVRLSFDASRVLEALEKSAPAPAGDGYEVVLFRDSKVDDGRNTNNGWLQELPEPVTKVTWENVVLLSPKTAKDLGIDSSARAKDGQYEQFVVKVTVGGASIEGPAWVQPGLADGVVGCALGYGRTKVGRVGRASGFNAYPLTSHKSGNLARGARLEKVMRRHLVAVTQEHGLMEGRPVVREATVAEYAAKPDFAKHMDLDAHLDYVPRNPDGSIKNIYQSPYQAQPWTKSDINQWAMTVDLGSCTGCSACVIACQAENNIPIVGKDQVARGREMQWMRIDRYYSYDPSLPTTDETPAADPQMVIQPMLCQHCENAPCESVCPVNATVHDSEGLNVMAYNRCIGTRYCSNNCPYKVRRFNFFDFNKRQISYAQQTGTFFLNVQSPLYHGPFGPNQYKETDWDVIKLVKNPDVTVRMRGAGQDRGEEPGQGQRQRARAGRHGEDGLPGGLPGRGHRVREHSGPRGPSEPDAQRSPQLHGAGLPRQQAAGHLPGAHPQPESLDAEHLHGTRFDPRL